MPIEAGGSSALAVALSGLAIGGLLLGAGVLPSLGDHAPGSEALDVDQLPSGDAPQGADEQSGGTGPGGSMGQSDSDTSRPSSGGLLGDLLGSGASSGAGSGGTLASALQALGQLLPLEPGEPGGDESAGDVDEEPTNDESPAEQDAQEGTSAGGDDQQSGDESTPGETAGDESTPGETADDEALDDTPSHLPYLLAGLGALGVLAYLYRTDADVFTALRRLPRALAGVAVGALLALSDLLERAVGQLRRVESLAALPGLLVSTLLEWIESLRRRAATASLSPLGGGSTAAAGGTASEAAAASGPSSARSRIHDAWETVVDAAPGRRYRTEAPGEVAEEATATGLPEDPVRTITDAFRDVEYGQRDPEERVGAAESAHATLADRMAADADDGSLTDADADGGDASE
jgi:hypothetical protein